MLETVFSAPDKVEFLQAACAAGFFARLFFICTDDPSINHRRIARRTGEGGHDVPPAKILSRYSKSLAQCAIAVKLVDRAYIYDNSIDDADPQLLFRTENGALKKVYRQPVNAWAKPILEQVRYRRVALVRITGGLIPWAGRRGSFLAGVGRAALTNLASLARLHSWLGNCRKQKTT